MGHYIMQMYLSIHIQHLFLPYFNGHRVVWIVDLVSDMCDHVLHKLRLVDEACTVPS